MPDYCYRYHSIRYLKNLLTSFAANKMRIKKYYLASKFRGKNVMVREIILIISACLSGMMSSGQYVNFTSSNLPVFIINTTNQQIPDEPKISARLGIIYNGPGQINSIFQTPNYYDGYIGIELRGNSTQHYPKKPYAIETRDSLGENLNVSLFGMR